MASHIAETTEFDTNLFGEGFNRPEGGRMVSTRVLRNSYTDTSGTDNEYMLRSHDRMNFYDYEDQFRADFPKHFRNENSTQILFALLDGMQSTFSLITLNQLSEYAKSRKKSPFWADIFSPTMEDMERIKSAFKIHELTIEDIISPSTREKFDEFSNYLYVVFRERQVILNSNSFTNMNINILVFDHAVLTIHNEPINNLVNVAYNFTYRLEGKIKPDWVLYKFLDCIADNFFALVGAVQADVVAIDDLIMKMVGSFSQEDLMIRISEARRRHSELRDALINKRDILITLSGEKKYQYLSNEIKVYLRDVVDHIVLSLQRLELAGELLSYSNNTYMALISISLTRSANDVNQIMKRFSATALILLPATIIAGLWGMNVPVPGGTYPIGGAGYVWFLLIILAIVLWSITAFMCFKNRGWL